MLTNSKPRQRVAGTSKITEHIMSNPTITCYNVTNITVNGVDAPSLKDIGIMTNCANNNGVTVSADLFMNTKFKLYTKFYANSEKLLAVVSIVKKRIKKLNNLELGHIIFLN